MADRATIGDLAGPSRVVDGGCPPVFAGPVGAMHRIHRFERPVRVPLP